MKKFLETERLILRNYLLSDIDDYWEFVSMDLVGPMAGFPKHTDKNKTIERLKLEVKNPNQFAIVFKAENKVVGSIEIMDVEQERYKGLKIREGAKELGTILSEKYWNKGIITEATKEIVRYAFEELNVPEIFISCAAANIGSGRVQEKCGFKKVGEIPNYATWIDGTSTNLIQRKMTQEEYFNMGEVKKCK